ncbi:MULTISPECIES: hypothetical protein [unclassified Streptomyces]|uniref:hypothetical protein n=1 Tax=unclassified Streptomyces TaxID=2593676 RepID=UPI0036ED90BE
MRSPDRSSGPARLDKADLETLAAATQPALWLLTFGQTFTRISRLPMTIAGCGRLAR